MTENAPEDTGATFAAGTDHAINAPDGGPSTDSGAPVATAPTSDTSTDDAGTVSDTADAVPHADVVPVPNKDVDNAVSALDTDRADVDDLIRDIHKMVTDVHKQVMSIVPLVEQAGPIIDKAAVEIKEKGILGLLPHILAGFRG